MEIKSETFLFLRYFSTLNDAANIGSVQVVSIMAVESVNLANLVRCTLEILAAH